jgi:glycogen operon protein
MLSMGDELGRSQAGNNNAYAQDNETSWIDWDHADRDLTAFVAQLCALRRRLHVLAEDRFLTGRVEAHGLPDIVWLAPGGSPMSAADWAGASNRCLGMVLASQASRVAAWFNAGREAQAVFLPETAPMRRWRLVLASDTARSPEGDAALFPGSDAFDLPARSVALLVEEAGAARTRGRGGVAPAMLDRLAELAGIGPDWWEVSGRHTIVSPDTKRALLAAMGFPATTQGEARDALDRLTVLAADPVPAAQREKGFVPRSVSGKARRWGVSAQLYTMRRAGDQGVGDFTTLRLLAEGAARNGAATIALNPLHALFPSDRDRASPYQPSDRRFLDPAYIDLDAVPEIAAGRAALAAEEAAIASLASARFVDWRAVWRIKRSVLEHCFVAALADPARKRALDIFARRGGDALQRFALFQALEEEVGGTAPLFPPGAKADTPARQRAMLFAIYLQLLADEQLSHAAGAGLSVGLYRDLAVGAAPDGAEVWSAPDAFMKGVTVGAPPDPFSAAGQVWNIPPLDPVALRQTDYAHFRELLRANMRHAGALRIDHAMALTRLFVIPQGAAASAGAYVHFPIEGMVRALAEETRRARCLVIGEDLGTVPEGFRERMGEANVFSYRVLFFERDGDIFRPPEAYPRKSVACVATHDLPTLKGWWSGADLALSRSLGRAVAPGADAARLEERRALAGLVGEEPDDLSPSVTGSIHRFLASSSAALVLAQAEDLADEPEPVNLPGTEREYPNWRRRVDEPVETLLETPTARAVVAAMKGEGR